MDPKNWIIVGRQCCKQGIREQVPVWLLVEFWELYYNNSWRAKGWAFLIGNQLLHNKSFFYCFTTMGACPYQKSVILKWIRLHTAGNGYRDCLKFWINLAAESHKNEVRSSDNGVHHCCPVTFFVVGWASMIPLTWGPDYNKIRMEWWYHTKTEETWYNFLKGWT